MSNIDLQKDIAELQTTVQGLVAERDALQAESQMWQTQLNGERLEWDKEEAALKSQYNACHAELVQIMRILHCIAEAPAPSMEQTVVVRGVCELADRVKKADDRVRVLVAEMTALAHGMISGGEYVYVNTGKTILDVVNATPQQTAEQIERWRIEWMKTLPVTGWIEVYPNGFTSFRTAEPLGLVKQKLTDVTPLVAIPPLPKE